MTNIDKLKKVIQKANPEIMDLKFGCEVIIKWQKEKPQNGYVFRNFLDSRLDVITSFNEVCYSIDSENKKTPQIVKILGRPITLADVLIVFMNAPKAGTQLHDVQDIYEICTSWNLQKNNLDDQSDETKQFLIDLLT